MSDNRTAKIVVIGGGVIGAMCAWSLSKAGCNVTIIESDKFGAACSHGNCGYVSPSHVLPLPQPGAIKKTLTAMLMPNSPFAIKPRFSKNFASWFWHFARRCNRTDMLAAGEGRHLLLKSSKHLYQELIQTACLMVPELGVVFDAGTGLFRARNLLQTDTLDIFLSHVHLDHSIGLTFLYDVLHEKNISRVTVHVAENKIEAIKEHLYHPLLFPVKPNFEIKPFDGQPVQLDDETIVSVFPLEHHPGGSHGFRLNRGDSSIAYITDTIANKNASYIDSIRGVDSLVHECHFPDGWEDKATLTGHSCLTPVAEVAKAAGVKSLYLVHINPLNESDSPLDIDSIKPIFDNVIVANDQMVIQL